MKDPIEKEIAEPSIAMENKEEEIVVENPTPTSEAGVVHERVVQDGEVIVVGEGETSPPAAMETEEMSFEAPSSEGPAKETPVAIAPSPVLEETTETPQLGIAEGETEAGTSDLDDPLFGPLKRVFADLLGDA